MARPQPEGSVYLSSITLSVPQSGRTIGSIVLKCETTSRPLERQITAQVLPGQEHKELFEPPLELLARNKIMVKYRPWWRRGHTIDVKLSEVMNKAEDRGDGKQVYSKSDKYIKVTIDISRSSSTTSRDSDPFKSATSVHDIVPSSTAAPSANKIPPNSTAIEGETPPHLTSITSEILRICPRFRLLIIGNTGVGKSTLVRDVFGVDGVHVSESSRGEADIDKEFVAVKNNLFVVHDSLGFEAGDSKNMDIAMRFIDERRKMADVKDRLHAVWVCISVPYAGGRLLEAGIEEFLKNRRSILGDVPVVIVITKLDLLDSSLLQQARKQFKNVEEMRNFVNPRRSAFLEEHISEPLRRALGSDVPCVAVSTKSGFGLEPTVAKLVTTTTSQMRLYVPADASSNAISGKPVVERNAPLAVARMAMNAPIVLAAMAQRRSVESKVELVIDIARKGYWKNISASIFFSSYKMSDCVPIIHQDIVRVWNFDCTEDDLKLENFPTELWNANTSHLKMRSIPNDIVETFRSSFSNLLLQPYRLPLAPINAIAKLIDGVCSSTQNSMKCFIAYIADLVYVMQFLFILDRITRENIDHAFRIYEETYRESIHNEIAKFDTRLAMAVPRLGGCDVIMDEIERLIRLHLITDADALKLRARPQT